MKVAAEKLDLDGFVLLARIGEGPGAATYSALDRRDGRKVIVRQASGGTVAADALLRERTVLSKVRHPNMVRLIDSGTQEDLALLPQLDEALRETSICGLGQIALTPVLSVLEHFPKHGAAR